MPARFCTGCRAGDARWLNDREWALDLRQPLAAGQRCTLKLAPGFAPLGGPLAGATEFAFSTGAPVVISTHPRSGQRIEEDQHFLLRSGSVIVLDPEIPMEAQRMVFKGQAGPWFVDGRLVGTGTSVQWLPRPGRHVLQRRSAEGADQVVFEVRAAPWRKGNGKGKG